MMDFEVELVSLGGVNPPRNTYTVAAESPQDAVLRVNRHLRTIVSLYVAVNARLAQESQ